MSICNATKEWLDYKSLYSILSDCKSVRTYYCSLKKFCAQIVLRFLRKCSTLYTNLL